MDVPKKGIADVGFAKLAPRVIEVRWSRNDHLKADELHVTLDWLESGVDPRQAKNARLEMFMWDDNFEALNTKKHIRFLGIVKKISRKVSAEHMVVEVHAQDYTTMFIHMQPFPERGVPEWGDTLAQAWAKICDHTGYYDPNAPNECVSSVEALRDRLRFPDAFLAKNPSIASTPIGAAVPSRFHAISKPPHKQNSNAWDVWQNIVTSLGLMSYIDKDECIVTDAVEHYDSINPASLIFTQNILDLEESADTNIAKKGVLLQALNPLTGVLLESHYPPPGDERIKVTKATAKRAAKAGRAPSENETAKEYIPYQWHETTDQKTLDKKAYEVYHEINRQELEGQVTTAEMRLPRPDGSDADILDLQSGDALRIVTPIGDLDAIRAMPAEDRIRYMMLTLGYASEVAALIAENIDDETVNTELFHVTGLDVEYKDMEWAAKIRYHNRIITS